MDIQSGADTRRLPFLDHLRSLMVVLVLIFHAGASYASAVDFWPFHDANTSGLIDFYMFLGDVFLMGTLFFIAGFFAPPSYEKRGFGRFLRDKLKTLGLPWLVVMLFVLPVLDYIHYTAQVSAAGIVRMGYGRYWLLSLKKIAEFHVGWMEMDTYRNMTEHFYQRYMWFLSLLLLFFGVFSLLRLAQTRTRANRNRRASAKSSYPLAFAVAGGASILLFGAVKLLVYPEILAAGWFSLCNIIQFQMGKMIVYAACFALGVYAYSRRWFRDGSGIGRWWVWGILCFSLFGMNMLVFKHLSEDVSPLPIYKLAHTALYPAWIFSFVGLFLAFAYKHWNRETPLNRTLAVHSFDMYLVHYVFPMTLPLLLRDWSAPALVKFGVVAAVTVLGSYGISRFLLKPFPKAAVIGIAAGSAVLAIVT